MTYGNSYCPPTPPAIRRLPPGFPTQPPAQEVKQPSQQPSLKGKQIFFIFNLNGNFLRFQVTLSHSHKSTSYTINAFFDYGSPQSNILQYLAIDLLHLPTYFLESLCLSNIQNVSHLSFIPPRLKTIP